MKKTMMKYFNSGDIRRLKEQSEVMFEELSDGIFYVSKDRADEFPTYVTLREVVDALNDMSKISVSLNSRSSAYANFLIR